MKNVVVGHEEEHPDLAADTLKNDDVRAVVRSIQHILQHAHVATHHSHWPENLRGDLQALPPRRAVCPGGVPLPVGHRRVPFVRRTPAVQAERGFPRKNPTYSSPASSGLEAADVRP